MKQKFNVKVMAEVAVFAAIAFALDALQGGIWKSAFPNGGSIGLAMVPIFIISYRRGLLPGLLCAFILSVVQMLGGIYIINSGTIADSLAVIGITSSGAIKFFEVCGPFLQVLFDYVLAYTFVGFAGAFSKKYFKSAAMSKKIGFIILGCVIGGLLKYACHVLSGLFFWPGEIFGISGAMYSFIYNGLYCIPNIIICTIIMVLIARFYPMLLNPNEGEENN